MQPRKTILFALCAFALAAAAAVAGRGAGAAAGPVERVDSAALARLAPHAPGLAKLEPRLAELVRLQRFAGAGEALRTARRTTLRTVGSRIRVVVEGRGSAPPRAALLALGRLEAVAGRSAQALLPIDALPRVAARADVRLVRTPSYLVADAVPGEEVAASSAVTLHQRGVIGTGVKVAVIDGGFSGLAARQSAGDLPSSLARADFCRGGFDTASEHGTAVAEIVHEMAPGAPLLLICVGTEVELAQAAAHAKAQGAKIINLSAHFPLSGRGDGSGIAGSAVADARANGILWVNAAGNSAQDHWSGAFSDPDGNTIHNFAGTDEGNTIPIGQNGTSCAFLKWDEWPAAVSDFDLGLFNSVTGQIVAISQGEQSGTAPPLEGVCYSNPGAAGNFGIFIRGYRVTTAPRLDVTTQAAPPLEYQVAAGSITDPASSPSAFAVGAACYTGTVLEPYSSQGPTIDGRVKPDITGHDSASSATYGAAGACGTGGFPGTSAASPEVAGAAALVKQLNPSFDANALQAFLESRAIDAGPVGKDTLYGAGILSVAGLSVPNLKDTVRPRARALPSAGRTGQQVKLLAQATDDRGEVRLTHTVRRGGQTLATLRGGFRKTKAGAAYAQLWRPPAAVVGRLQHCVQASDRAGNTSGLSCARLTISAP